MYCCDLILSASQRFRSDYYLDHDVYDMILEGRIFCAKPRDLDIIFDRMRTLPEEAHDGSWKGAVYELCTL